MSALHARDVIHSIKERLAGRRSARRSVDEGIIDARQIAQTVSRERARADRTGRSYSLILLRPDAELAAERKMKKLAASLRQCIRETDALGYFDGETLCVVLPDTDAEGASRLAERFRRAKLRHSPHLAVQTYHAPDRAAVAAPASHKLHVEAGETVALRA